MPQACLRLNQELVSVRRQIEVCDEGMTMNAESRDREIETLQRVLAPIEQAIELQRPKRKTRRTA
jgi:hypothetical protein